VTDRVLRRRDLYPRETAFYEGLANVAPVVFAVDPAQPGLVGPWVRVYRLDG
jgi:hypothetical protein